MRISPALLLLLLLACGSGPKDPQDPARAAAQAQRERLQKEEPARPFELRQRTAYRPPERCGQGPYRLEVPALRARYAEELRVYACGLHDIAGNYRYSVVADKQPPRISSEAAFGWRDRDNAACKIDRATAATASAGDPAGSSSGDATRATGSSAAKPPAAAPAVAAAQGTALTTVALERVTEVPTSCTARIEIINITHTADGDYPPMDGRLLLEIWSEQPNDYEAMVFVVEQHAVVADMTRDRWTAYREAYRSWSERYIAFIDGEVAAGRTSYVDSKVTAPPPPPPRAEPKPPRPSKNARWIPGYWHYESAKFHWIAGLWDVPPSDIEQELTVVAPKPPPAAPPPAVEVDQPPEPQPTATAVWTPGQWQWDGSAYVWVDGAWRIPPKQGATWQPPRWTIRSRGAIYVPGRWRIRIGR